ncbi:hypothetical protein [Moorena sp. SIO2C4]|nr:hypothetical protein [Moorena sp. SIO2C4]
MCNGRGTIDLETLGIVTQSNCWSTEIHFVDWRYPGGFLLAAP